ncbi:hypothetical protein F4781DRAFT_414254 [Annulohypoxylon bovei var. microspora]|nr:hypothetical protein F4781DRAFT_414254 [Annulohypoxylon bovei var. microspora]
MCRFWGGAATTVGVSLGVLLLLHVLNNSHASRLRNISVTGNFPSTLACLGYCTGVRREGMMNYFGGRSETRSYLFLD